LVSAQAQHSSKAWHVAVTPGTLATAVMAVAERDAPYLTTLPEPRSGRPSRPQSQNSRPGSAVSKQGRYSASASTKHSAGMLKKLSSACSAYAKFLRLTSPNFLVTGPAALLATASPRSSNTLIDCFMVCGII
jgi:hypothetical protein